MTVTEWAQKERVLSENDSASPGLWNPSRTPYLVEILNSFSDRGVARVTFIASRQVGKTTTLENIIGFVMRQDPGPLQIVLPSEDDAKNQLVRIKNMIDASPALREEKTPWKKDWGAKGIQTKRMPLRLGWAGGPSSMKGRSNRFTMKDELESWPMLPEGHPARILDPSRNTFWNSKDFQVSTPIFTDGYAYKQFQMTDRCRYWVPCPHCGKYQRLKFSRKTLRWPADERDPERIEALDLAMYHCEACEEPIPHRYKQGMLLAGKWVPECCTIDDEGVIHGERPKTTHRGFQISALYSPWITWSRIAKEFLVADQENDLQTFYNLWLGEPWDNPQLAAPESVLESLEQPYRMMEIPTKVQAIVAGADLQWSGGKHLYYVVRGFGPLGERWLIDCGRFDADPHDSDIDKLLLHLEHGDWVREDGREMSVGTVFIDSGDGERTAEVYRHYVKSPHLVMPCKGRAGPLESPVLTKTPEKAPNLGGGKSFAGGVRLSLVDTDFFKSQMTGMIISGTKFWFPEDAPEAYRRSLISEQRVIESRGALAKPTWKIRPGFSNNHWWDSEVYCSAAAWYRLLHRIPEEGGGIKLRSRSGGDDDSRGVRIRSRRGRDHGRSRRRR